MCVLTKCPQTRCNVVVPHSYFMKYIKDEIIDGENLHQKYLTWHCKQFTDQNPKITWCPRPNCVYVIEKNEFSENIMILCKCGERFCFECGVEDHLPATC